MKTNGKSTKYPTIYTKCSTTVCIWFKSVVQRVYFYQRLDVFWDIDVTQESIFVLLQNVGTKTLFFYT